MDTPEKPIEGRRPMSHRPQPQRTREPHTLAARIAVVFLDELAPWIGPETPAWPQAMERAEKRVEQLLATERHQ